MRKALLTALAAATLTVPALAGTAQAAPVKASVVGTSACGKTYPAGYWWTYPTTNLKLRSRPWGTSVQRLSVRLIMNGRGPR